MLKLLSAILIAGLVGCQKPVEEVVPQEQYVGLLACMMGDLCRVQTRIATLDHVVYYSIKTVFEGNEVSFRIFDNGIAAVTYAKTKEQQTLLEDLDMDGKIDRVTITIGDGSRVMVYDSGHQWFWENFSGWQGMYVRAMNEAWTRIVPDDIRRSQITKKERRNM